MNPSEIKTCVPWFSLNEWNQAYEDLFSRDSQLQKRGYEQLLVWKARIGSLPAGVECTMGFMQVHLQDEEISKQILKGELPLYAENDLRLIFSTAVLRFFNFIATLAQAEDSLYAVAKKLNIPEWLVSLRHDAAHRSDLPPLTFLRSAVEFGLEWLNDHYWLESRRTLSDWVIKEVTFTDESVAELIDVWQGLKMYELDGCVYVDELSDRKLQEYLGALQAARKKGIPIFIKNRVQLPSCSSILCDQVEDESVKSGNRRKLKAAIRTVRRAAVEIISKRIQKDKQRAVEKFVLQLVNSDAFIPSEHFANEICEKVGEKLNGRDLPEWLRMIWKDLLVVLQKHYCMFPLIVHKLVQLFTIEKDDHRQLFMALWIKELCLSMIKWRETKVLVRMEELKSGKQLYNFCHALAKVEKRDPHLTKIMFSIPKDETGNSCSLTDLKHVMTNPQKYTALFVPSLLDVTSPAISDAAKDQLMSLVAIYIEGISSHSNVEENDIFTIENLEEGGSMDVSETCDIEESSENITSPAVLFSSFITEYDWSKCPLGILPWQQEALPKFNMPAEITWTQSLAETTGGEREKEFQHLVRRDIDWKRVQNQQSAIKRKLREKRKINEFRIKLNKRQNASV